MKNTTLVVVGLVVALAPATAEAQLYRDLVRGNDAARADAALEVLKKRDRHAQSVIRRAAFVASSVPRREHLIHLTHAVRDKALDASTRAAAALALGVIGRKRPRLWPPGKGAPEVHIPLPVFAKQALRGCTKRNNPIQLRRACVEAIGEATVDDSTGLLEAIVNDKREDAILRIAAGRSITRIAGVFTAPPAESLK